MKRAYHPVWFILGFLVAFGLASLGYVGADGLEPVVTGITDAQDKLSSITVGIIAILSALLTISVVVLVYRRLSS